MNYIIFFILFFIFILDAFAFCPLCTVLVGSGLGFSRYLNIDDVITGLWLGALVFSLVLWTENFFDKKNIKFKGRFFLNFLLYYFILFYSLYGLKLLSYNNLNIFGIFVDKIIFGIIAGSIVFYFSISLYDYLKIKNNNKPYFPFQKVLMPIFFLLILSFLFYFLIK